MGPHGSPEHVGGHLAPPDGLNDTDPFFAMCSPDGMAQISATWQFACVLGIRIFPVIWLLLSYQWFKIAVKLATLSKSRTRVVLQRHRLSVLVTRRVFPPRASLNDISKTADRAAKSAGRKSIVLFWLALLNGMYGMSTLIGLGFAQPLNSLAGKTSGFLWAIACWRVISNNTVSIIGSFRVERKLRKLSSRNNKPSTAQRRRHFWKMSKSPLARLMRNLQRLPIDASMVLNVLQYSISTVVLFLVLYYWVGACFTPPDQPATMKKFFGIYFQFNMIFTLVSLGVVVTKRGSTVVAIVAFHKDMQRLFNSGTEASSRIEGHHVQEPIRILIVHFLSEVVTFGVVIGICMAIIMIGDAQEMQLLGLIVFHSTMTIVQVVSIKINRKKLGKRRSNAGASVMPGTKKTDEENQGAASIVNTAAPISEVDAGLSES